MDHWALQRNGIDHGRQEAAVGEAGGAEAGRKQGRRTEDGGKRAPAQMSWWPDWRSSVTEERDLRIHPFRQSPTLRKRRFRDIKDISPETIFVPVISYRLLTNTNPTNHCYKNHNPWSPNHVTEFIDGDDVPDIQINPTWFGWVRVCKRWDNEKWGLNTC